MSDPSFPLPNRVPLAIVGAGTQALTLVLRLLQKKPKLRGKFLVFDPAGSWMQRWCQQFANLEIPHLRSPAVHHPHPYPYALRQFAEGRPDELFPPYDLPGTRLFQDFCSYLVGCWQLQEAIAPFQVIRLEPTVERRRSCFRLWLDGGTCIRATRVVVATGGGVLNLPAWVETIDTPYPRDRLCHSSQVVLPALKTLPERVLIVGGGLTAGHLALGAIHRGARVTLMTRRTVREKLFDADPGWLGPKYLKGFTAETDWEQRWLAIQQARDGGSITPEVLTQLRRFSHQGALTLQEACQIVRAKWLGDRWHLLCDNGEDLTCDRLWLATGTRLDAAADALLAEVLSTFPVELVKGLPILDNHLRLPGSQLFLMGGLAALQLGPVARNLYGARMASDRIVPAIVKSGVR